MDSEKMFVRGERRLDAAEYLALVSQFRTALAEPLAQKRLQRWHENPERKLMAELAPLVPDIPGERPKDEAETGYRITLNVLGLGIWSVEDLRKYTSDGFRDSTGNWVISGRLAAGILLVLEDAANRRGPAWCASLAGLSLAPSLVRWAR